MKLNEYSAVGWVAAAWVMTIGGSACVLWSSLAIKPISMLYEKAEKIDMKLVLSIGAGCLAGVMAYVSVSYGFSAMSTKGVVFCISFAVGALLVWIHNKKTEGQMVVGLSDDDQYAGCDGGSLYHLLMKEKGCGKHDR